MEFQGASCLSPSGQDHRLGSSLLRNPTLNKAQKFLGKAIFARRAVPLGRAHLRALQMAVIEVLHSDHFSLNSEAKASVEWWSTLTRGGGGVEINKRSPSVAMTTDASNSGWDATLGSRSASCRSSAAESRLHINHLELLAVFKAVHCFTCHLRMKTIALHLDNVTSTSYLNKEGGGTKSAALNRLTLDSLIPAYLPGVANLGEDALSRGQVSREWFLNPSVVEKIFKTLGRPQVCNSVALYHCFI